jgi:hypothetical protein
MDCRCNACAEFFQTDSMAGALLPGGFPQQAVVALTRQVPTASICGSEAAAQGPTAWQPPTATCWACLHPTTCTCSKRKLVHVYTNKSSWRWLLCEGWSSYAVRAAVFVLAHAGLASCAALAAYYPFMPTRLVHLLVLVVVLGSVSSVAFSTSYQLVAWFRWVVGWGVCREGGCYRWMLSVLNCTLHSGFADRPLPYRLQLQASVGPFA